MVEMQDRRSCSAWFVVVAVALVGACDCGAASHVPPDAGSWADALPAPYDECDPARERPRPEVLGGMLGCTSHADCTEGRNGRCVRAGLDEFACTYDECASSADCGAGERCACDVGPASQHLCLRADCTGPGDCDGLPCDVSFHCAGPGVFDYSAGDFLCHTERDACRTHADCPDLEFCTRGPRHPWADPYDGWRCEVPSCGW